MDKYFRYTCEQISRARGAFIGTFRYKNCPTRELCIAATASVISGSVEASSIDYCLQAVCLRAFRQWISGYEYLACHIQVSIAFECGQPNASSPLGPQCGFAVLWRWSCSSGGTDAFVLTLITSLRNVSINFSIGINKLFTILELFQWTSTILGKLMNYQLIIDLYFKEMLTITDFPLHILASLTFKLALLNFQCHEAFRTSTEALLYFRVASTLRITLDNSILHACCLCCCKKTKTDEFGTSIEALLYFETRIAHFRPPRQHFQSETCPQHSRNSQTQKIVDHQRNITALRSPFDIPRRLWITNVIFVSRLSPGGYLRSENSRQVTNHHRGAASGLRPQLRNHIHDILTLLGAPGFPVLSR